MCRLKDAGLFGKVPKEQEEYEEKREQLLNAQALLERDGVIQGTAHRYFLVAEKVG
jgi:hypothetical protein